MYVNDFSYLDPLVDAEGVPLTAGGSANGDGAIFQVGYFPGVSHLLAPASYTQEEWTSFTPLTGLGSLNAERHPTTIGGVDSRATGPFGFLFYPSAVAIELDTKLDEEVPMDGLAWLGVRFLSGTTLKNSTAFNIVTSDDPLWMLPEPDASPATSAVLDLDEHVLVWASGAEGTYQTSLSLAPEPGMAVFGVLAGLALLRRRRPASGESGGCGFSFD